MHFWKILLVGISPKSKLKESIPNLLSEGSLCLDSVPGTLCVFAKGFDREGRLNSNFQVERIKEMLLNFLLDEIKWQTGQTPVQQEIVWICEKEVNEGNQRLCFQPVHISFLADTKSLKRKIASSLY